MKASGMLVAIALAAMPVLASAQANPKPAKPASSEAALRAEAKISEATARATALAAVPGGTIQSAEVEREMKTIVYSFDITVPGKAGVEEVLVSALNGKVLSKKFESPKAEAKEARKEAKEAGKEVKAASKEAGKDAKEASKEAKEKAKAVKNK